MSALNMLLDQSQCRLKASVEMGDNGEGAKTAPVRIVANSGQPIEYPGLGRLVWDFASMKHANRIPLDYAHEDQWSRGYLNRFDVSSGSLVCSGAIVIASDVTAELVALMREGTPFQASIESHGGTLELVMDGEVVTVNGNDIAGPCFVLRDWTLAAVAICKFGQDMNTSSELVLAANKKNQARHKVKFVAMSKETQVGESSMNESEVKQDQAAVAATTVEAKAVETEQVVEAADVKAETIQPTEESKAETAQVVEASEEKTEDQKQDETAEAEQAEVVMAAKVEAVDPRKEFQQFVATFGAEKAATYFGEGLTFEAAMTKFAVAVKEENDDLKKRLAAIDRGADKPVTFSASEKSQATNAKTGMASVIRLAGSK
jgi:hypothetical protein